MTESNGTVVGVTLFHQHVAVEAAHFGNGEHTDATERTGLYGQNFTLRNVGTQDSLTVTLQTVEGDIGSGNVALQCTTGEVGLAAFRLQQTVLDQLVLHSTIVAEGKIDISSAVQKTLSHIK